MVAVIFLAWNYIDMFVQEGFMKVSKDQINLMIKF